MNATLANLITNANGLRVFCDGCDRCVVLDVDELVSRYGGSKRPKLIVERFAISHSFTPSESSIGQLSSLYVYNLSATLINCNTSLTAAAVGFLGT